MREGEGQPRLRRLAAAIARLAAVVFHQLKLGPQSLRLKDSDVTVSGRVSDPDPDPDPHGFAFCLPKRITLDPDLYPRHKSGYSMIKIKLLTTIFVRS